MPLYDGSRFRGRFVDVVTADGKKLFAVACGESICTGDTFQGRFVGVVTADGKKLFATTSEGCQPPINPFIEDDADETCVDATEYTNAAGLLPFLVESDAFPPHGLSRLIQVRAAAFLNCPEYDCKVAYLVYNEPGQITSTPCDSSETVPTGRGVWTGCVGEIDVHLWLDPAVATVGHRIRYCLSGCIDDDPHSNGPHAPAFGHLEVDPSCGISITDTVSLGEIFVRGCCEVECADDALFHVALTFKSFCGGYRAARFVDVAADGKKVFAISDCNTPVACTPNPQNCCTPLAGCDLTLTVPSGDFAGVYTLKPDNHTAPFNPPLGWVSDAHIICGVPWTFEATCTPHPTDPTKTIFNVTASGGGLDCFCATDSPLTDYEVDFPCFPLEVSGSIGPFTCTENSDPPCDTMCVPSSIPFVLTL